MVKAGYRIYPTDPAVVRWAAAAHHKACEIASDPDTRLANLRHGETWFVGVDALPNAADGSVAGVPLLGPWQRDIVPPKHWHRAQLSIVFPGYPGRDDDESAANHRYRVIRHAAHVDGLLPQGAARRRYLKEPHAFILGLPLNASDASPLMVWPGSHHIMGEAFADLRATQDPTSVDVTDLYQSARRCVFDQIEPVPVSVVPGQAVLLHRHLLHGVAPWAADAQAPPEGRMIAYFRPQFSGLKWCQID